MKIAVTHRLDDTYIEKAGTGDIYFPVKWAPWLAEAIPGAKPPVELEGARIFFPEERAEAFNQLLRDHDTIILVFSPMPDAFRGWSPVLASDSGHLSLHLTAGN